MKASALITELYPPAVRDRWGGEIRREVAESGIASWPDALTGAARLWLHPSDWPEAGAGQTRRVLTAALFTVCAVTALVLRAIPPSAGLTADTHHLGTSLWPVPLLIGFASALPVPVPRRDMLHRLAATAVRVLAAPAVAFSAMLVIAHSGLADHPGRAAPAGLVVYYWATLGFIAFRLCVLMARIGPVVTPPGTGRLRTALLLTGSGLALAAGQSLLTIVQAAPHLGAVITTLTLGALAAATLRTGHDLRGVGS